MRPDGNTINFLHALSLDLLYVLEKQISVITGND